MAIPISNESPQFEPQSADLGANIHQETGMMVSKAFDELGKAGITGAKLISNNILLGQMNTYQAQVDKAKLNIATNPSISNIDTQTKIVDNATKVSQSIPLLGKDKYVLGAALEKTQSAFDIAAARAKNKMANKGQDIAFRLSYPQTLQQIHSFAAQGDLKAAHDLAQKLNTQVVGLVATGAVPPSIQLRIQKEAEATLNRANDIFSRGPSTSKDPVRAAYDGNFAFGDAGDTENRQKMATQFKYDATMEGMDLVSAKQEAVQGIFPSGYLTDPGIKQSNYDHVWGYYQGATYANAHVATGLSYPLLQAEQKNLNTNKLILTPQEEGVRDALSLVDKQIKNNYFAYYTSQTNGGKKALTDYNAQAMAIKNSNIPLAAKQQQMLEADRKFRQGAVVYGQTMKIPPEYIHPFAPDDPAVIATQSSFLAGQNVTQGVNVLRNKTPSTPYLVNSLASPTQQETAHLVSIAPENDGAKLVLQANQNLIPGTSLTALDKDGNPYAAKKLSAALSAQPNVSKYLNFVASLPNGAERLSAVQKTLHNSLKYCLSLNATNTLNNCTQYINNNIVPKESAYLTDSVEGANYTFLPDELHMPLSSGDAKAVAAYVANEGYKSIKNLTGLKDDSIDDRAKLEARKMTNPLQIGNTPDGQLIAFNKQTGAIAFQTTLTPDLMTSARLLYAQQLKAQEEKRAKVLNVQGLNVSSGLSFKDKTWDAFGLTEKLDAQHQQFLFSNNKENK
jgi:hypothetical protein